MEGMVPTTDRARRVLDLADGFARNSARSSVEAEHLLLALAAERDGIAAHALTSFGVDADAIRNCLQRLDKSATPEHGGGAQSIDQLLPWAHDELAPLGHTYVGTEHLLLALTRITDSRYLAVLAALKLDRDLIREEVYSILGHVV